MNLFDFKFDEIYVYIFEFIYYNQITGIGKIINNKEGSGTMSDYGEVLKKLIRFTDMKMSAAADIAGYDISYISKWCNKSKLPAARVAGNVNRNLAKAFAGK